ncbi:hypothetical protein NPIL_76011 [Nephila pilipes]|uniref:Uncharacterized protein n=1 Tax=Nephila pilipes TaxID=299642 RepID=A0A8X6K4H6_NEPPI|nr:hypothetical protein NPIL_76011 [Nephila pilipes]
MRFDEGCHPLYLAVFVHGRFTLPVGPLSLSLIFGDGELNNNGINHQSYPRRTVFSQRWIKRQTRPIHKKPAWKILNPVEGYEQ